MRTAPDVTSKSPLAAAPSRSAPGLVRDSSARLLRGRFRRTHHRRRAQRYRYRDDAHSGTGIVHHALLIAEPERTVVRGPFRPFPHPGAGCELALVPKPPWFVTARGVATVAGRRLTHFAEKPSRVWLPAVSAAASLARLSHRPALSCCPSAVPAPPPAVSARRRLLSESPGGTVTTRLHRVLSPGRGR